MTTDIATPEVVLIPLPQLIGDDNIRAKLGDLSELTASVRTMGVLVPLIVEWVEPPVNWEGPDGYRIVAGHRRFAAAHAAKLETVPCIVASFTEAERLCVMLVENAHRLALTPTEQARTYLRIVTAGMTKGDLSKRTGVSVATLTERMDLLSLPAEALKLIDSGELTLSGANFLLKAKDRPDFADVVATVLKQWSHSLSSITYGTVSGEMDRRDRRVAIKAMEAEVRVKGWTLVNAGYRLPAGHATMAELGIKGKALTAHKRGKCHGVRILNKDYGKPALEHLCTNTAVHAEPTAHIAIEPEVLARTASAIHERQGGPSKEEQEATEAEMAAIAAVQRAFLAEHVRSTPRADKVAAVLRMAAGLADQQELLMLGVDLSSAQRSDGDGYGSPYDRAKVIALVEDYGRTSATKLVDLAYAVALDQGTVLDDLGRRYFAGDRQVAVTRKLVEMGYVVPEGPEADRLAAAEASETAYTSWKLTLSDEAKRDITWFRERDDIPNDEIEDLLASAYDDNDDDAGAAESAEAALAEWRKELEEQDAAEPGDDDDEEEPVGTYSGDEDNGDEITSGPRSDEEDELFDEIVDAELVDDTDLDVGDDDGLEDGLEAEGLGVESGRYDE